MYTYRSDVVGKSPITRGIYTSHEAYASSLTAVCIEGTYYVVESRTVYMRHAGVCILVRVWQCMAISMYMYRRHRRCGGVTSYVHVACACVDTRAQYKGDIYVYKAVSVCAR